MVRPLPTLKLYKSSSADGQESHGNDSEPHTDFTQFTQAEVEAIRILQRDLPLQPRPFDALARVAGIGVDELMATARSLQKRGHIRRFGASLSSRKVGILATAMGVWNVPAERADEVGAQLSQHRAVSHCYLRPVYADWPYNVYTTVHGRSVDECESIINDLAADTGISDKRACIRQRSTRRRGSISSRARPTSGSRLGRPVKLPLRRRPERRKF